MPGANPPQHDAAANPAPRASGRWPGGARPAPAAGCAAAARARGDRRCARRRMGMALVLRRFGRRPHAGRLGGPRGRRRPRLFLRLAVHRRISVPHSRATAPMPQPRSKTISRPTPSQARASVFAAEVYHPTGLTGDIAGPLTSRSWVSRRVSPPIGRARG